MKRYQLTTEIPSSKSFFNRALVAQSFFPQIKILGKSDCEDVEVMHKAIKALQVGQVIPCGDAGTVIRFMAFRASRQSGSFILKGSHRLMARPQFELKQVLQQLGVRVEQNNDELHIQSSGWQRPSQPVVVRADQSSQFLSGLLLSAWDLPFDLQFEVEGPRVSNSYWEMTLKFCQRLGLSVDEGRTVKTVKAGQKISISEILVEPDFSSAFPLAVAGSLWGESQFLNLPAESLQPDSIFPQMLKRCGAGIKQGTNQLHCFHNKALLGTDHNLLETPDLFPVLAVLAAFSEGSSFLGGAPHLQHKESDRLQKTEQLLTQAGVNCARLDDGLRIQGQGRDFKPADFTFDPDQDHRMAMAAGLLRLKNSKIHILTPEVVAKSFPGYWKTLQQGCIV